MCKRHARDRTVGLSIFFLIKQQDHYELYAAADFCLVFLLSHRKTLVLDLGRVHFFFFFFQAEDGIRDVAVTGVQTCALPISSSGGTARSSGPPLSWGGRPAGSGAPGHAWREPRGPRARARAGACERRGARWRRGAPARRPTPRAPRGGRGSRAAWGRRARRRWHRARSLHT